MQAHARRAFVGSAVGQIGRIKGCRVVGIDGLQYLVQEATVDYVVVPWSVAPGLILFNRRGARAASSALR